MEVSASIFSPVGTEIDPKLEDLETDALVIMSAPVLKASDDLGAILFE
jgi:hypothetical protein